MVEQNNRQNFDVHDSIDWESTNDFQRYFDNNDYISFHGVDIELGPILILLLANHEQTADIIKEISPRRRAKRLTNVHYYRTIIRTPVKDSRFFLVLKNDNLNNISSVHIIKQLKKQIPLLEKVTSLNRFELSVVMDEFKQLDYILMNPCMKISIVRVKSGQTTEEAILSNGIFIGSINIDSIDTQQMMIVTTFKSF